MWRVRVVAVLSVILCSADSSGQQPNRPPNADVTVATPEPPSPYFSVLKSRVRQSLDGQWRFRFDARDTGETNGWFRTGVRERICQVPGSWQIVFDDLSNTVGTAWYEREFKLDARFRNRRIAVVFCGANYHARIWVNGQLAGEHEGGQLPFALDISTLARFDRVNRITVRVSDPADQLELPVGPAHTEMHRVSGIWRGVWLEATGTTYVSDLHAAPDIDAAVAHIQTSITSPPRDREKSTTLRLLALRTDGRQHAAQIRLVLPKSDQAYSIVVKATIKIDDPWLWTPDTPHLYQLQAELADDDGTLDAASTHFGMRKIDIHGTQVRLNNRPIFLRGVNDWQDTPDKNQYLPQYRPPSDADFRREVKLIKKMGFNVVRKACQIEDHRFLDWADRLGLLVYGEPPYTWRITENSIRRWRQQLVGWVRRDRNHPSVIFWGLYNANAGLSPMPYPYGGGEVNKGLSPTRDEQQQMVTTARSLVRKLDRTRPIIDTNGGPAFSTDINAAMIYGVNGPQFHVKSRQRYAGLRAAGKPFLIGEVGGYVFYPDMDKFKKQWGGRTPLPIVRNAGRGWGETQKMGVGYEKRFYDWGLDRVYGSFAGLAKQHDWSVFADLKDEMEQIRKNPDLCGYVITAFSNIGPFVHGMVDYDMSLRPFHAALASFQTPDLLIIDWSALNYWSDDKFVANVTLSHYSDTPIHDGVAKWRLEGFAQDLDVDIRGQLSRISMDQAGVKSVGQIVFTTPQVERGIKARLHVELFHEQKRTSRNYVDIHIYPRRLKKPPRRRTINVTHIKSNRRTSVGDSTELVRLKRVPVSIGDRINFLIDPRSNGGADTVTLHARITQSEDPARVWDVARDWSTDPKRNSETSRWSKRWIEKPKDPTQRDGKYKLLTRNGFFDRVWNIGDGPPQFWTVAKDRGPFTWKNDTKGTIGISGSGGVEVPAGKVVWNPVNIGSELYMAIHSWLSPINGHVEIEFRSTLMQAGGDGVRLFVEKNNSRHTLADIHLPEIIGSNIKMLAGYRVSNGVDPRLRVTLASAFSDAVRLHVADGGTALLFVTRGSRLGDSLGLTVGTPGYGLGDGRQGSAYVNPASGLFKDIVFENPLGWTFHRVLEPFKAIGGLRPGSKDDLLIGGYSEWLRSRIKSPRGAVVGELNGLVAQFRYKDGRLVITTLDLLRNLQVDPVATIMFHDLVEYCHTDFQPTTVLRFGGER